MRRKQKERRHKTWKCIKGKRWKILPPTKASPAPFVSTMSLGSIFSTGNVSTLSSVQTEQEKSDICCTSLIWDKRLRDVKGTRGGKKEKIIENLTQGHGSFVFPLCQHYNPRSLCVHFGQSLSFLGNFLNVCGL